MRVASNVLTENPVRPSGALGYYMSLVRELAHLAPRDTFFLLVSPQNHHFFPDDQPNLRKIFLPFSNERQKARVVTEHLLIPGVMVRNGIDVLNTGNIAPLYVPGKLVATIKTMHAFVTPYDLPAATRMYRRLIGRLSARRADVIIANSEANKGDIVKYFRVLPEKVLVVYEAVDHGRFFPIRHKAAILSELGRLGVRPPYILFVSSLWRYKNAEVLVRAFGLVKDYFPQHRLVIAGHVPDEGYKGSLMKLVNDLDLSQNVDFLGGVNHDDTAWLYRGADVMVYPSRYETFGLPIPEAFACACPVIVSNVSALPEIAGGSALLFDPTDEKALAERIMEVLGDESLRQSLIDSGLSRARDFSWHKTAEGTMQAYRAAKGAA